MTVHRPRSRLESRGPSARHAPAVHGLLAATALLASLLAACDGGPTAPTGPLAEFDLFWDRFDRNYSYFGYKGIDWSAVREEFRPRAAELESRDQLIDLLLEVTAPMRDGHVWFTTPDGRRIPTYIPGAFVNWDRDVWERRVRTAGWQQRVGWGWAWFGEVPYLVIETWNRETVDVEVVVDAALEGFRDAPALIIDLRMNAGGSDAHAYAVAARFTSQPVLSEYYQFRDGPSHDDFTELTPRTLEPRGTWQFERPIALLVGRGVFSSSESFVSAMRELPHVTVMGDTTGGSSGNPRVFDLGGGWSFTVPRWIGYTAELEVIEWRGIAPDIQVPTTAADFAADRDPVLEYALQWAAGATGS